MNEPRVRSPEWRRQALAYLTQLAEKEAALILPIDEQVASTSAKTIGAEDEERTRRAKELAAFAQDISTCTRCGLSLNRTQVVFGVGDPCASLMLVGEGPGADEDRLGEPFVGRAGQLLTRMLDDLRLSRSQVYIANIVKCRPPGNREPTPEEAETCLPYLMRQIGIIRPKVIVALGKVAAQYLLTVNPSISIRDLRGRPFSFQGSTIIATYHPAAILRNPDLKAQLWQDLNLALTYL